jgi:hypothetical protein
MTAQSESAPSPRHQPPEAGRRPPPSFILEKYSGGVLARRVLYFIRSDKAFQKV